MTSVSVIICAYSNERRRQLDEAICSVLDQTLQADRIVIVIDHNDQLLADIRASFPGIEAIANQGAQGLSGARNTGIRTARTDVIAFLDDDAIAEPNWLCRLTTHYTDPKVIGTGGKVMPLWQTGRPHWFPEEFQWVVGCSYKGQPETLRPVRNPIGCNMSFRQTLFDAVGGFREDIGRLGQDAAGCEETELCIRAQQLLPGTVVIYDPQAVVYHHVTAARSRWSYFRKRCLAEGRSKNDVVKAVGTGDGLAAEQAYVTRILPGGVLRGLVDTVIRFDGTGLLRAAGIVAGLAFTTAGYSAAKFKNARKIA